MKIHRNIILVLAAVMAVVTLGCSDAEPPTDPAATSSNLATQGQMAHPDSAPLVKPAIVGTWGNNKGTVTIRRHGESVFRIVTETPEREIDGLGHLKGNELIAVRWYLWDVNPANADRHVFGTYWVDANDVLHAQSYTSDGTPAFPNTFFRIK